MPSGIACEGAPGMELPRVFLRVLGVEKPPCPKAEPATSKRCIRSRVYEARTCSLTLTLGESRTFWQTSVTRCQPIISSWDGNLEEIANDLSNEMCSGSRTGKLDRTTDQMQGQPTMCSNLSCPLPQKMQDLFGRCILKLVGKPFSHSFRMLSETVRAILGMFCSTKGTLQYVYIYIYIIHVFAGWFINYFGVVGGAFRGIS